MKKKYCAALLILAMAMSLLPATAFSAGGTEVRVGEITLSSGQYTTDGLHVAASVPTDNYAYFETDGATSTLTLHNFSLS